MLSQRRDLEPWHITEAARSEIHPVPVDGEAAQLELDQATDEAGAAEVDWSPSASRPMMPVPQLSIASLSFRSKIPLGKVRRNLERMVPATIEWVGGIPSGATPRGSLYQPSKVIHWSGATRADAVIHSVCGCGPSAAIRGNSGVRRRGEGGHSGVGHLEA